MELSYPLKVLDYFTYILFHPHLPQDSSICPNSPICPSFPSVSLSHFPICPNSPICPNVPSVPTLPSAPLPHNSGYGSWRIPRKLLPKKPKLQTCLKGGKFSGQKGRQITCVYTLIKDNFRWSKSSIKIILNHKFSDLNLLKI